MLRTALRNLFSHKLRLSLTVVTIMLGIAFVSGTFVFTDSLQRSFDALFDQKAPDVTVSPGSEFTGQPDQGGPGSDDGADVPTLPAGDVARLAAVPGVAAAYGEVRADDAILLRPDGETLGARGAPTRAVSWLPDDTINALTLTAGRPPSGPGEVALLENTATAAAVGVGGSVRIDTPEGGVAPYTVVGLVTRGVGGSLGGTLVVFDLPTAQRVMLGGDAVTDIAVRAGPGTTPDALAPRLQQALSPTRVTTQTATQARAALADRLDETFTFVNTFLVVFGLIALFVAGFLIFNTFSMLVAQRTRELALLRAVGATRRQVQGSVLVEAFVLGVVSSTLGLLAGLGVSQALRLLFGVFGAALPAGPLVVEPRTVVVAYVAGVVVTMVSAFLPARRAAVVPPVAAMRDDVALPQKSLRRRLIIGLVLVGLSVPAAVRGLSLAETDGTAASTWIGISALMGLIGAIALAPNASRPVLGLLSRPFARGPVGRLARENSRRNPRRTAATSSALAIGLALMTAIGVIAASAQASVTAVIDDTIGADFVVFGTNFQPFTHDVYKAVDGTPGTRTVTYVRQIPTEVDGQRSLMTGVDPTRFPDVVSFEMTAGRFTDLSTGTVLVDSQTATDRGLNVGQDVAFVFRNGRQSLRLVGTYTQSGPYQGFVVTLPTLQAIGALERDSAVYIRLADGADATAVKADLESRLAGFPAAQLQDQEDLKNEIVGSFNRVLGFIYALLALAVVVAFLGIVNTLSLSVVERTREIGLLRAVGTSRLQIRRMVRLESSLIALFGALVGVVIGLVYGTLLQRVLEPQGISVLAIPTGQIAVFLVLGALGGLVAALWPAWRASRLDVLRAIATE